MRRLLRYASLSCTSPCLILLAMLYWTAINRAMPRCACCAWHV